MKQTDLFTNKRVLVLGLAKSGSAAARLLGSLGAEVTVNDAREEDPEAAPLSALGIEVILGGHPDGLLERGFDFVFKNPGIRYDHPVVSEALEAGIPVWTEVELAWLVSEAPFIGVTGSNGKTTTTTLIHHMLHMGGKNPLIAGNIGTPACTVAAAAEPDQIVVIELSSFQLLGTEKFRPKIAIWTNLYEAHIDYHGTMEEYGGAKFAITRNQGPEDFLIYNADQESVARYASLSEAKKIPFTLAGRSEAGISADGDSVYWLGEKLFDRSDIVLPGRHNLENVLSATAAAILSGCPAEAIVDVLSSFAGVRHRTQFVREWKRRKFYNDSKATNTLATKSALEAFRGPICLLAGGLDRGHSFEELRPFMDRVSSAVVFGETASRFREFAASCGVPIIREANEIEDAVRTAAEISSEGDTILLSPACASWDQYPSFEVRGDRFIESVQKL
ncbi:UDP-N-acetylmuramoyl-L-alanine--D-glutamate ligase [Edaphobacillus lindanitolerans]|uniref:UDP-N-acetylmuramoylalanine--D-glutamate ligase n=1 Tax=Edaphobacillus lindanitolerans TaxID=550447 RepID=A0A1U7PJF7_9BACI|nr:UDP-N-acetylmuramoyl-L-alanine--D-glutamate ligase [Edaphobacillus lindanitolerans]SIT67833.1 UDP-N-acetylmuramoylalanine--D-glutamate ligase [Edaphobacillus lindanitolerans]